MRQGVPFDVRKNGEPIENARVSGAVDPKISYSAYYSEFDAAIAAGASLDELLRLEEYPKRFRAKLVAWYGYHRMIEMHSEAASMPKGK